MFIEANEHSKTDIRYKIGIVSIVSQKYIDLNLDVAIIFKSLQCEVPELILLIAYI